jgi:NAD-dependent dihydropyrimidine dehydrogenase PreA subunit
MAGKKLTVVISQAQGKNPARRNLEEELAAALLMEPEINVSLVPHLYDMDSAHTGMLFLCSVPGDLVVLSWLYPRAARWTLDRQGVRGHEGMTLLKADGEDEEDGEEQSDDPPRGIGSVDVPNRKLYCLDLRAYSDHLVYVDEVRRISKENSVQTYDLMQWIQGSPKPEQLQRYLLNSPNGEPAGTGLAASNGNGSPLSALGSPPGEESTKRRWYPVIDYSRCTNCMECIDFCLFGVYGVDALDRILVEQQDNCKKGCPACSRVCPENAIIFPGHKTPAIAGASGEVAGFKIDLSKLFGGSAASALDLAVAERDAELVRDGRDAVGMSVGIPKRQTQKGSQPRDALDDLMDGLDALDL